MRSCLIQVIEYYHETLLRAARRRLTTCKRRGIGSDEAIKTFKLGFANRTLGYRLPERNSGGRGGDPRGQLQRLGLYAGHPGMSISTARW